MAQHAQLFIIVWKFWASNRSCKRNLDLSKIAFSPRRKHYFSHFFYQNFMENRFKIACQTECVLRSLLVSIFTPQISILRPSWHHFWLLFGIFCASFSLYIFSIVFLTIFSRFFLDVGRSWSAQERVNLARSMERKERI